MSKQPATKNEEDIRAEASSRTINITLRDIFDILIGKPIKPTGKPLRDRLTRALLALFHHRIILPPMPHAVVTPAALEPCISEEGWIDPSKLTSSELRDLLQYLKTLEMAKVKGFTALECILYVKFIEGIFAERLERKQKNRRSGRRRSWTPHVQNDLDYAQEVHKALFSRLTKKELQLFDLTEIFPQADNEQH